MSIAIFFIVLLVLVLVHEFGHFWTAKKFGIRVDEFGFGFPPKLFSIKKGETEYSFNLLPIGGFVRIFGENPNEESINGPDKDRSFINKAKWKQAVVLFAGVTANFLLAWVLFSFGFMSGFPTAVGSQADGVHLTDVSLMITSVLPNSPAEEAGFRAGDRIISAVSEGKSLLEINPETFKTFVVENGFKGMEIDYLRGADTYATVVTPRDENNTPVIGISMEQVGIAKMPFFTSLKEGMILTLHTTYNTFMGLSGLIRDAFTGNGSLAGVAGPVGMVGIVGDAYQLGFSFVLSFAALISINLAIINLLPFPALDGGRLLFLLIEKLKGSRLNPRFANTANFFGFSLLIILMLVVTYHDVVKLF